MATEIEMKLSVPDPEILDKVLSDPQLLQYVKDDYETRHMKSTYYDTPDNLLHQRKWTLRLRDEGGQSVAAFKTANMSDDAGFFTRNEWQCTVDNIEDAIPMLIDQGAPRELKSLLKGKGLVPCCGASSTEHPCTCIWTRASVLKLQATWAACLPERGRCPSASWSWSFCTATPRPFLRCVPNW